LDAVGSLEIGRFRWTLSLSARLGRGLCHYVFASLKPFHRTNRWSLGYPQKPSLKSVIPEMVSG